jgi:acyl carrier protein
MSEFLKGLSEILEVDESKISSTFLLTDGDAPWDSLAVVSVIALIDELYSKTVDGKSLAECKSIGDIEALVAAGS